MGEFSDILADAKMLFLLYFCFILFGSPQFLFIVLTQRDSKMIDNSPALHAI